MPTKRRSTKSKVWADRRERRYQPGEPSLLTMEARFVVAAVHTLGMPARAKPLAKFLNLKIGHVSAILRGLKQSRRPAVRGLLYHGLPMHASVALPDGIEGRCQRCRQKIYSAPCVACWAEIHDSDDWPEVDRPEPDPPQDPCPTLAAPGTLAKVLLMQQRVAAGLSAFSDGDARWHTDATNHQGYRLWPRDQHQNTTLS